MFCHDLEVMSSNPGRVDLGVHNIVIYYNETLQVAVFLMSTFSHIMRLNCYDQDT